MLSNDKLDELKDQLREFKEAKTTQNGQLSKILEKTQEEINTILPCNHSPYNQAHNNANTVMAKFHKSKETFSKLSKSNIFLTYLTHLFFDQLIAKNTNIAALFQENPDQFLLTANLHYCDPEEKIHHPAHLSWLSSFLLTYAIYKTHTSKLEEQNIVLDQIFEVIEGVKTTIPQIIITQRGALSN